MTSAKSYTADLNSAQEFLDYLRPSADHWSTHISGKLRWVFRGQRDATWRLMPSAWRDKSEAREEIKLLSSTHGAEGLADFRYLLDRCRMEVPERIADVNEQSETELRMLQEFIAHANVAGISFPHSSVEINVPDFGFVAAASDLENTCCDGFEHRRSPFFDAALRSQRIALPEELRDCLPAELRAAFGSLADRWPYVTNFTMRNSVAALAQHHGIPTRLLDWTHDSRKAAFFACSSVADADLDSSDARIAVFGLNPFMLRNRFIGQSELEEHLADPRVVELFLSTHSIFIEKTDTTSYLAAQEGLFTYPENADLYRIVVGRYPTIDESIELMTDWHDEHVVGKCFKPSICDYIRKVTLPYSQIDELMELLDDERILLTTLMPNLDRFKESMLSRSKRQRRLGQKKK